METSCSVLLWRPYTRLGLGEAVGDGWALEQTIAARLTEPISKAQPHRILGNPGGGRR